jgi:hypothetical protein
MFVVAVEPENSLDSAAVAAVVTTTASPITTLGTEGKDNSQTTLNESIEQSHCDIQSRNYPPNRFSLLDIYIIS